MQHLHAIHVIQPLFVARVLRVTIPVIHVVPMRHIRMVDGIKIIFKPRYRRGLIFPFRR